MDLTDVTDLSLGRTGACAVTFDGHVRCWGTLEGGPLNAPSDLVGVSKVKVAASHACVLTSTASVRCWGSNAHGMLDVPADLGAVSEISVGAYHTCALVETGALSCWGWNFFGQTNVPSDLGTASAVSSGQIFTCALTVDNSVRCWGNNNNGQLDVPADLGEVKSLSSGGAHVCALIVSGSVRCWGWDFDGQTNVPADLGEVKSLSSGLNHTCGLRINGSLRCWGGNSYGQIDVPSEFLISVAKNPTNVFFDRESERVVFQHESNAQADGQLTWTIRNVTDGTIACLNPSTELACRISDLQIGKTYVFSVQGANEAGKTSEILSSPYRFCPLTEPSLQAGSKLYSVVSGATGTIKGKIVNLCEAPPSSYQSRYQVAGGAWSKWTTNPLTSRGEFTLKQKVTFNTKIQLKATTRTGTVVSTSITVAARTKKALPLSFSWTPSKSRQGFNQGALVKVTFSGDSGFTGRCVILGETKRAYNFALTYMGSESRVASFAVKNGSGMGKLQMTWNGFSNISALCNSAKYQDVFDFRLPVFKANF